MFAMSVNDVPGWLVTIPPSAIGVPVAVTPGLVPHDEVAVDALVAAALVVVELDEAGAALLVELRYCYYCCCCCYRSRPGTALLGPASDDKPRAHARHVLVHLHRSPPPRGI